MDFHHTEDRAQCRDGSQCAPYCTLDLLEDLDKIIRLAIRASKASLQEFQLVNCRETHGRSSGSPESKSC